MNLRAQLRTAPEGVLAGTHWGEPSANGHEASPIVRVEGIAKNFAGGVQAVKDISFSVHHGEIFTLLGPSGCGKSTTLRLIAGLDELDRGTIYVRGRPVVAPAQRIFVQPDKRDIGMVFQSYALWPHMTVEENVAYPLRVRRYSREKTRERVREALELVGLAGLEKRQTPALSGGQQQRVALARALAPQPDLLLLDEPFSNLDAKLRDQMRVEMKLLQKKLNLAIIFVTHDQVEALSLSSRVALLSQGVIQQVGTPQEVYEQPVNEFVRDFIGRTIMFRGSVRTDSPPGQVAVKINGTEDSVVFGLCPRADQLSSNQAVFVCIRPDDIEVLPASSAIAGETLVPGVVETALFVGERIEYRVAIPGQGSILAYGGRHALVADGQQAVLRIRPEGHTVWPIEQSVTGAA